MSDIIYEWGVKPIDSFMNNLGYYDKRMLITNALRNNNINAPFTKKEIIEYATQEAATGIMNASYSAIQGFKNDSFFVGLPAVNPVTNIPNTIEEQKGVFGEIGDYTQAKLIQFAIIGAIGFLVYERLKK